MTVGSFGLGQIIAVVVLILAVVFISLGGLSPLVGGLLAALAIARIV